jgi:hypothetical protein
MARKKYEQEYLNRDIDIFMPDNKYAFVEILQ